MSKSSLSSEEKVCDVIINTLKKHKQDNLATIDIDERFDKLGLDSLSILLFISDLEEIFSEEGTINIDLPVLMQHPTPSLLAGYIYKNLN